MRNPYRPSATSPQSGRETLDRYVSWSQVGIWGILLIIASLAFVFAAGFVVNLGSTFPGTEQSTLEVAPLWVLLLGGRAVGFGYIAYLLLMYVCKIRTVSEGGEQELDEFMALHMKCWFRAAVIALVLFLLGLYEAAQNEF